ncbi:accessory Sec system translocase SecA2 [Herbiconiux sp. CPCC 203407]|uniref:Protein translocase subunit SecA n=1 Tax=Herbiconiux oxytropis TaxID=2970915 RepID=A0AA42BV57_9MICO|nr:accessory Sec system translocase SecA2 [Herbiconiux oxytropis]MCS5720506.1 accessory Sec system translocase SecA2 [Herbiconiux oxytropis]MCS5726079.1 accessory Sec system translocase SecA2 [Herbiconiux oxytropis]
MLISGPSLTRLRAFLGIGGVASFHRFERLVASTPPADESSDAAVVAALREAGGRRWSDDELRLFCRVAGQSSARTLGQRPFSTQLIAALALLGGHGVQLATGEGKTLAGAIAAVGFVLQGRRVHVISVNDYLARRDAEWMGPLFGAFGATVGWVSADQEQESRRLAYAADVVYVSAAELGFDTLRDRFRVERAEGPLVRPDVAIVDEVDAVLIDEASTPLVLAAATAEGEHRIDSPRIAAAVAELEEHEHFEVDTDRLNVSLTEAGTTEVERRLGVANLFDSAAHDHLTAVNIALHARALVQRDVDYLVREGRLELISAARGRVAVAQRWPDGLHEAIEVKEGLRPSAVSEVLDSITVSALITSHRTVCGMSGTALAVAPLLAEGYGFTTGEIGSRLPSRRIDHPDRLFRTRDEKHAALLEHISSEHATGRPVLVGTASVAASEQLADDLGRAGVATAVLNARNDAEEAAIIARAGEFGRVTISTQMAGRGTDIRLGGADEGDRDRVTALGGLCVIGAERYDNGRLDDQLRGRAGRQGDPGSTSFFASLDDAVVQTNLELVSDEHSAAVRSGGLDRAAGILGHAQRMSEVSREQQRAATLRFAETPARQRAAVLRLRTEVLEQGLRAPDAGILLTAASAADLETLEREFGESAADAFASRVALFHLDESWCRHAALLAEAREGIHLRSLGRDSPHDEFVKIAQQEFAAFLPAVASGIGSTLAKAVAAHDIDGAVLRFLRPGSTWTYMVSEDPFGSPENRLWNRATTSLRRFLH